MKRFAPQAPSDSIARFLADASLAPRQAHKSLTLWPLIRAGLPSRAPEYITLSEAHARGDLTIDELRAGARVPHVLATNRGAVAVLVLFGEEIRGAKQNRIANASFLVPPMGEVVLDVSCVEHGRWSRRSHADVFESTGLVMSSEIRRKMTPRVASSQARGHGFQADQGEVWAEIGERVLRSQARSSTGAYADYVATRGRDLEEMADAFHTIPDEVGFVACIGEEVAGLEVIGRPEVFARAFPGLLRGYLIDAIDHAMVRSRRTGKAAARFDAPEAFLAALARASVRSSASLGLGTDLRVEDGRISACALVEGEVVHLTAFPAAG